MDGKEDVMKKLSLFQFCLGFILILGSVTWGAAFQNKEVFPIGDMTISPGEMKSGFLNVPEKGGIGSKIPLTVINGAKPGKTLALVAGIHAFEYPPILSLYKIKKMIDPAELSGTLILVHIANLHAFQKRIIYYNPNDWKNLNRVFPGDPEGSISERIAHVLKEEVIQRSDCLIDLHCGDGNEALIPYLYWMVTGNEKLDQTTKKMALAFGIKHIIIDKSRTKDLSQSKYLGNTSVLLSTPAITTESGYLGRTDQKAVLRNVKGVVNVMKFFKMIEGTPKFTENPVWIDHYEVVRSDHDGLFYPLTEMGYYAAKGEKIGYVTDYFGKVVQEFYAPFSGMILYIVNTPPANKGEPVYEIGRVKEK